MEVKGFWLINFQDSTLSVSLVLPHGRQYTVASLGPQVSWQSEPENTLLKAVDTSLSQAAADAGISESDEPSQSAFILPPYWVGVDGRIVPNKLKLIELICKELSFKPLGFISNDEAIVEEANLKDGFPASFILLNLTKGSITVSLVYLGKIKDRKIKAYDGEFNPSLLESSLVEMNSASALPPQIIVFGDYQEKDIESIKNYPWIGRKDIETFLHLPDIKSYSLDEVSSIYTRIISAQFDFTVQAAPQAPQMETIIEDDTSAEGVEEIVEDDSASKIETVELEEVDPSSLGFSSDVDTETESESEPDSITPSGLPIITPSEIETPAPVFPPKKKLPEFKFSLPKFRLPKFNFSLPLLYLPALLPLLLLIPFLLSKAVITLYVTPYTFAKLLPVTFDSTTTSFDEQRKIIPVEKKIFSISASESLPATGHKTIGEKAKGEIIIFNKLDKSQNLPKGAILTDANGRKYQLVTAVNVTGSTSNLDQGILTFGQTRAMVEAADIGPDYNIVKDSKLVFKDYPENSYVAKTNQSLTGGTKQDISAVSDSDKKNLDGLIKQSISQKVSQKIHDELPGVSGMIGDSIKTTTNRVEFSREVGEEADTLSATVDSTVSVFVLREDLKQQLITAFLKNEPGYSDAKINYSDFNLGYTISSVDADKAVGSLNIQGQALPAFNESSMKSQLSGKSLGRAETIIKKDFKRVYNYQITTNFNFLRWINPLPFQPKNITFNIKTN